MAQTRKPRQTAAKRPTVKTAKVPAAAKKPVAAAEPPAPAVPSRWSHWLHRVGRAVIFSPLPELFLIASLCMARYLKNSDFSYPSEVVLDFVLLGVIMVVLFYALWLVLRRRRIVAIHTAGLLLAYELFAYNHAYPTLHHWIGKLVPHGFGNAKTALFQLVVATIVFGLVGYLLDKLCKVVKQLDGWLILKIAIFVVCFVFVSEAGKMGLRMWTIRHDLAYKLPPTNLDQDKTGAKVASKPDVYYLLFDRYASAATFKNDYNYNNPLFGFLSDQGFVTRDNAYANYPFTMQSVSSTLAMGYHTAIAAEFKNDSKNFQTAFPYRAILDNPPAAQAFKASGYNYNQVSSWWDFTRNIPAANDEPTESFRLRIMGKNFWLSDLQRDIVNNSILSPLLLHGFKIGHTVIFQYQLDRDPQQNFAAQINAVETIAKNSATDTQPQFTFAHVLSPHDPYVFDADCNTPTYDQNRTDIGVDETVKYVNQVKCINKSIETMITTIRSKDPGAVVVLQADEGPYPKQFRGQLTANHHYNPINLPLVNMRQKVGVLASYYLPGVSPTAKTSPIDSSVNSFRYVLDHYLGYKLPLLPDCQFSAGDKYTLYTYQLITGQLKGTTNPAVCKQYL